MQKAGNNYITVQRGSKKLQRVSDSVKDFVHDASRLTPRRYARQTQSSLPRTALSSDLSGLPWFTLDGSERVDVEY